MNNKIKNYVDVLFTDIPSTRKAKELKEEILCNLSERFEDYISQGNSENQAYTLAVSSIGDVDEMLSQVMPDADFVKEAGIYRHRNAKNTAIAVMMYIIGPMFLIGFAVAGEYAGYGDEIPAIIGLLIMLLFIAVATGIIVFTNMSTPPEFKSFAEQNKREYSFVSEKNNKVKQGILSIFWTTTTFIYLAVSFMTMAWHITWIIWILATIFAQIITTIFEMRGYNE